jgi:hypothetical protein
MIRLSAFSDELFWRSQGTSENPRTALEDALGQILRTQRGVTQ